MSRRLFISFDLHLFFRLLLLLAFLVGPGGSCTSSPGNSEKTNSEKTNNEPVSKDAIHTETPGEKAKEAPKDSQLADATKDASIQDEHPADKGTTDEHPADKGTTDEHLTDKGTTDQHLTDSSTRDDGKVSCKHDCDCVNIGMVCQNNTCQPLERLSMCLACNHPNCKKDDPCHNPDKSIGKCPGTISCTSDCDCKKHSLNCENGTCQPTKRINTCPNCTDASCPKDAPCANADGSIGKCGVLPSCNDQTCPANTLCKMKDGSSARCCCSIAGCPSGSLCCASTGVRPPPGYCGQRCFKGTQCPPPPP